MRAVVGFMRMVSRKGYGRKKPKRDCYTVYRVRSEYKGYRFLQMLGMDLMSYNTVIIIS